MEAAAECVHMRVCIICMVRFVLILWLHFLTRCSTVHLGTQHVSVVESSVFVCVSEFGVS